MLDVYSPDYRIPSEGGIGNTAMDIVRYDMIHKAGLARKFDYRGKGDKYPTTELLGESVPDQHLEKGGSSEPTIIYQFGKNSEIYSRDPDVFASEHFGTGTSLTGTLHRVESRVRAGDKALHFDQLPEVRDLQYRMLFHPLVKSLMSDPKAEEKFKEFKSSLTDVGGLLIPKRPSPNIQGYAYFPAESFVIKDYFNPNEDYERRGYHGWEKSGESRTIDPFKDIYDSLLSTHARLSDESLQEHVENLSKSHNDLWTKFDSGLYLRHPNFWVDHPFSSTQNRDRSLSLD